MNSLQELNGWSAGSIEFTDDRGTSVTFSGSPVDQTVWVDSNNSATLTVGSTVTEVISSPNNAYFQVDTRYTDQNGNPAYATVTWPSPLPGDLVQSFFDNGAGPIAGVYKLTGTITKAIWDQIKEPTITYPDDHHTTNLNAVSSKIWWSDSDTQSWSTAVRWQYNPPYVVSYEEDNDKILKSTGTWVTEETPGKDYSVTLTMTDAIGNLRYSGSLANTHTITGNATTINSALTTVEFVPTQDSFANGNIRYDQTQTTDAITQASDVTIQLQSTGNLYDPVIDINYYLLSGNSFTYTGNVAQTDVYWSPNVYPYCDVTSTGLSGDDAIDTFSVTTATVGLGGHLFGTSTANIANVSQTDAYGNTFFSADGNSRNVRFLNFYEHAGYVPDNFDDFASQPSPGDHSYTVSVTSATVRGQSQSENQTLKVYSDFINLPHNPSQSNYNNDDWQWWPTGSFYRRGTNGATTYVQDLSFTTSGNVSTAEATANISVDVRHYPQFSYEQKALIIKQLTLEVSGDETRNIVYDPTANTFSYSSGSTSYTAQEVWEDSIVKLYLNGELWIEKPSGQEAFNGSYSFQKDITSYLTSTVGTTTHGADSEVELPITYHVSTPDTYTGNGSAAGIRLKAKFRTVGYGSYDDPANDLPGQPRFQESSDDLSFQMYFDNE